MALLLAATTADLKGADIYLNNMGSVQIWWAVLDESSGLLGGRWAIDGWSSAGPGERRRLYHSPHEELVHIVFGLRTPEGNFGAIKYDFSNARMGSVPERNRRREICVTRTTMADHGIWSSPDKYVPPCANNFHAVPTSTSVYISGNATLSLTVNPSSRDYGSLVMIDKIPNGTAVPMRPSLPNPAKNTPESKLQARGIELIKNRQFAEGARVLEQVPAGAKNAEGLTYLGLAYFHQQNYARAASHAMLAVGLDGFPDQSTRLLSFELQLFGNYLANYPAAEDRILWAYRAALKVDRVTITADIEAALRPCTGLSRQLLQESQLRQGMQKACLVLPDRLK